MPDEVPGQIPLPLFDDPDEVAQLRKIIRVLLGMYASPDNGISHASATPRTLRHYADQSHVPLPDHLDVNE